MTEPKNECVLRFKCSETEKKFDVTLRRRSANHKFRIHEISGPVATAKVTLFSRQGSQAEKSTQSTSETPVSSGEFEADDFDFSGWYCGCCRFAHPSDNRTVYSTFVRCGTCREYLCGASVKQISEGVTIFECVGDCQGGGKITGSIDSYKSSASDRSDLRQLTDNNSKDIKQLRAADKT